MHAVHYIRLSALVQIVCSANHGSVLELSLVVRGIIKVTMKQSLSTYGDRLWSGHGTQTYILNYWLSNCWLHELI